MATYQNPSDQNEATGENYRQLITLSLVLIIVSVLLGLAFWYGYVIYPRDIVLESEPAVPLVEEVPLDVIPVLPDDLGVIYDDLTADQQALLEGYEVVEGGTVRIPIDDAMDLLVEEGLPAR